MVEGGQCDVLGRHSRAGVKDEYADVRFGDLPLVRPNARGLRGSTGVRRRRVEVKHLTAFRCAFTESPPQLT